MRASAHIVWMTAVLLAWSIAARSATDTAERPPSSAIKTHPVDARPKPSAPKPQPKDSAASEAISIKSSRPASTTSLAHQALQQGDLASAKALYSQALASEPANLHALTALALLEARDGQTDASLALLQRAQSLAPRDGTVLALAAMIRPDPVPTQMESRLQNALAQQPDAVGLHFVLGNLYASQRRWSDAQNAFFHAVAGDAGNPDFLFNLAVSLEHLGHEPLALEYYRKAATAALHRPASYDPLRLQERLARLQQLAGSNR